MVSQLKLGKSAPTFELPDKDGTLVSLKKGAHDFTVVFFYPKDSTPGCTIEAKSFTRDLKAFEKFGASIIGISGGDEKSKTNFCKKEKLSVLLLSDTDFSVARKFGVYGEKSFMGRKFKGIFRNTFLLDKNLKILKIYEKVSPETHSAELLSDIAALKVPKKRPAKKAPSTQVTRKAKGTPKAKVKKR